MAAAPPRDADRITIAILVNGTHGRTTSTAWTRRYMVEDLERSWTLAEILGDHRKQPSSRRAGLAADTEVSSSAMAYIAEQVTGSSLAQLVTERITEPAETV